MKSIARHVIELQMVSRERENGDTDGVEAEVESEGNVGGSAPSSGSEIAWVETLAQRSPFALSGLPSALDSSELENLA